MVLMANPILPLITYPVSLFRDHLPGIGRSVLMERFWRIYVDASGMVMPPGFIMGMFN
jgi:hypothetical protein